MGLVIIGVAAGFAFFLTVPALAVFVHLEHRWRWAPWVVLAAVLLKIDKGLVDSLPSAAGVSRFCWVWLAELIRGNMIGTAAAVLPWLLAQRLRR